MDLTKYNFNMVCVCVFLIWITAPLSAANYVTVVTIGKSPHVLDKTQGMQKMVENTKEFWRKELEQVIPNKPDLIVLTEECDIPGGLDYKEKYDYLRVQKNQMLDFFASVAKKNHCYIVFGTKREQEDGVWRNSCILLDREGNVAGIYNKNFPTIGEMEQGIVPGVETPVFECDFGKVACAICFDLNFEELVQKYARAKPDIIVFPSMFHGGLVQSHWAIWCRSFFVGCIASRRTPSEIINPLGQCVASSAKSFAVATINLDYCLAHGDRNGERFSKLKEKYGNKVTINNPGRLGFVLITSEHESISIEEMVKEFDIELLDEYFNLSREVRLKTIR